MSTQDVKERLRYDVVVVGGGNAGLVAAIEAKNNGAKVLLIEKGPKATRGGNSRFTYGDFRVVTGGMKDFNGLLEREGLPKEEVVIESLSPEFFYGEALRLSEGLADKELTHLFVDRSLQTVKWMKAQGIRWTLNPALAFRREDHLFYPRGNANLQTVGSGPGLVEMLYGIAERKGIDIVYDTAAYKLLMNGDGKICGVLAKGINGLIQVDAAGVILCCGGFQASPDKRRAYLGEQMDLVTLRGTPYNTGDGIQMCYEVGAKLTGHWGGCHASPISQDVCMVDGQLVPAQRYCFPYGIMVNRNGARFVDEGENFYCWTYNRYGKDILRQPGSVAYQIFDAKVLQILTYGDALRVESDSLEGLAKEAGINAEGLLKTVKAFNGAIVNEQEPFIPYQLDGRRTTGLKPDKSNWAQKIDSPPYRAYAVRCGLTMTYGGVKTDEKARVLDTSERPIGGLYAVGEITGGYFYHTYLGGSGLIRGAVMGRIAGTEAVSNAQT